MASPVALVAFDLDGTLVHGETCVQAVARAIGRQKECAAFERLSMRDVRGVSAAREQMAAWYAGKSVDVLCEPLAQLPVAAGAEGAFRLLRGHGVATAIVSITWEFAVEWFARLLGADYWVGTRLADDGTVLHFWPDDKRRWLLQRARRLGVSPTQVAAVGDSDGDLEMLAAVGRPVFVGREAPLLPRLLHVPGGDFRPIARAILSENWVPSQAKRRAAGVPPGSPSVRNT